MATRVPQDVDLEDRLVFNLTPIQFGYLVIGALAAGIVWKLHWAPDVPRLLAALPLASCGAALAWGRWRGRGLDARAADAILFGRANARLRWAPNSLAGAVHRRRWRIQVRTPRAWRCSRARPRPPALPAHEP